MNNISDRNLAWLDKMFDERRGLRVARIAGVWTVKLFYREAATAVSEGAHYALDEAVSSCRETFETLSAE